MAEFVALAGTWIAKLSVYQIISAALISYSVYDSQRQARKLKRQMSEFKERTLTIRTSDMPQVLVYGRARVGGPIVYAKVHGDKKQYLSMVVALAGHECDAIEDVWFDDASIGPLDAAGYTQPGSKFYKSYWVQRTKTVLYSSDPLVTFLEKQRGENMVIESVVMTADASNAEGGPFALQEGSQWTMPEGDFTMTITNTGIPASISRSVIITYRTLVGYSVCRVKRYLGIPAGERDLDLEAASGGEWTADHTGRNICRLHITLEWDETLFGTTGLPNISAILRGKKVKDWQTDAVDWSDNAARCTLDYLTSPMGFGLPASRIDEILAETAQGICDEDVPIDGVGGTERRYTCNGVVDTSDDKYENLKQLLGSMAGTCSFSAGKARVRAGAFVSPDYTLDDDDLAVGPRSVDPHTPRRDLFNGVKGLFADPDQLYTSNTFVPYISEVYKEMDGGAELVKEFRLPFTNSLRRAMRLCKLALYEARQPLVFTATWKMAAYPLQPGDTFYAKLRRYAWEDLNGGLGKILKVIDRSVDSTGRITLICQETAASIYAWNHSEFVEPDPTPNTTFPDPTYVAPLQDFAVFSDGNTYYMLEDGTIVPYCEVTWAPVEDAGVIKGGSVELYWKRGQATSYTKQIVRVDDEGTLRGTRIEYLTRNEVVNVMARVINGAGIGSDFVFATHTMSPDLPGNVQDGTASGNRILNATFEAGVQGWRAQFTANDTISFRLPDEEFRIKGVPCNAVLTQFGNSGILSGAVYCNETPVAPGQKFCGYLHVLPEDCATYLGMEFLSETGAVLQTTNSFSVGAQAGKSPLKTADYTPIVLMGTAPANSARVRLRFTKLPTSGGASLSRVYCIFPFLGEVDVNQTAAPPWSPGPGMANVISANLLANSVMEYGPGTDWTFVTGGEWPGGHAHEIGKDEVNKVLGQPSNSYIATTGAITDSANSLFAAWSRKISVEAGTWLAGYAYVASANAKVQVQVLYFDGDGVLLSAGYSSPAPFITLPTNPTVEDFEQVGFVAPVPVGTKEALLSVLGYEFTSSSPRVSFIQPFLGKVPPGTGILPLWNNGNPGTVGTDQIQPGAAGRIVQGQWAGPKGNATSVVEVTFTLVTTADVVLSFAGTPMAVGSQTGGLGPASPSNIVWSIGVALVLSQISPSSVDLETRYGSAEALYHGEPPPPYPFGVRKVTSINGEYKLSALPAGTYTYRLTALTTHEDPPVTQGSKTYSVSAFVRDTHLTATINYR